MAGEKELFLICYISSASELFIRTELDELMNFSRRRNFEREITGALLYSSGSIMQIIEGPRGSVEELYSKIKDDPRHRNIQRLISRKTSERFFGDWSMACRRMTTQELRGIGAYSGLLDEEGASEEELIYEESLPPWIQRLVTEFRRINR